MGFKTNKTINQTKPQQQPQQQQQQQRKGYPGYGYFPTAGAAAAAANGGGGGSTPGAERSTPGTATYYDYNGGGSFRSDQHQPAQMGNSPLLREPYGGRSGDQFIHPSIRPPSQTILSL